MQQEKNNALNLFLNFNSRRISLASSNAQNIAEWMKKMSNYLLLYIVCFFLLGCSSEKIDTICIVSKQPVKSNVVIFFTQDTILGNVHIKNNKHYFDIVDSLEIFFIKEEVGEGAIEAYMKIRNELVRTYYDPSNKDKTTFQIRGGSYRGFYNYTKNEVVNYISFKGGTLQELEKNWEIEPKLIVSYYKTVYEKDSVGLVLP